jgi:hypothetical protein
MGRVPQTRGCDPLLVIKLFRGSANKRQKKDAELILILKKQQANKQSSKLQIYNLIENVGVPCSY